MKKNKKIIFSPRKKNKFSKENKTLKTEVSYYQKPNALGIKTLDNSKYQIDYPKNILSGLSRQSQITLLENFAYARLAPLVLVLKDKFKYQNQKPRLKEFIDFGVINDLPRFSEVASINTKKLVSQFQKAKKANNLFAKKGFGQKIIGKKPTLANQAIMSLSFGKDSLLSYGIAKEIGLNCHIAAIDELDQIECKIKRKIAADFSKKEKKSIDFLQDNIDEIFSHPKINKNINELENTNGMLTFLLDLVPLAFYHQAKYIIFGNEKNFDDSFINKYGAKAYPSFDQTSGYTKRLNQNLKSLTNGQVSVVSLVEPIYNIAEMHILYHRYPKLLKYLMSCSPKKGLKERWCYHCPMCAKAYLYSVAVGGDPKLIKFNRNFFEKKYQELYPLFSKKIKRNYEKPPAVKEEQLLAFLLAYRQGAKGALIDLFKKKYLALAEKNEKKLRKKFFAIYPAKNIPKELKNKVIDIYRQELKKLV